MPRQPIKPCNPNIAYWFWFPLAFYAGIRYNNVNTAIPAMAHHLNEDPLRMHSVVVAYVLSVAACIPLSGWLTVLVLEIRFISNHNFHTCFLRLWSFSKPKSAFIFPCHSGCWGALLLPVGRLSLLKIIPELNFGSHEPHESGRFTRPFSWSNTRWLAR